MSISRLAKYNAISIQSNSLTIMGKKENLLLPLYKFQKGTLFQKTVHLTKVNHYEKIICIFFDPNFHVNK